MVQPKRKVKGACGAMLKHRFHACPVLGPGATILAQLTESLSQPLPACCISMISVKNVK